MDYSTLTDEQLAAELAATTRLPPIMRRHDARALQSEIDRRRYAADNVARNLDAASTPLTPDPTVRPRVVVPPAQSPRDSYRRGLVAAGWEPDEVDRIMASEAGMPGAFQVPYSTDSELEAAADRERQYASDWHAREGQHAATEQYWRDVYGHNDQPEMSTTFARDGRGSAYAALTDFGGGQSDMVDGYSVPVFDIGDGRQRYRLGDLKRAQEAEAEARRVASVRALVDSDNAQYGHYSMRDDSPLLTRDQKARRAERAAAEKNEQNTDRAKFLRAQRERDRAMMPSEGELRRRRADMARLAGGSQNLHSGNNAMFQALSMLEGVDPSKMNAQQQAMMQMMPMDRNRAAVEAQNMANAGNVIERYFTSGAAAGMMNPRAGDEAREMQVDALPPEQQVAVSIRRGEPMGAGRSAAHVGARWNYWMNNFGWRKATWREQNFRAEMESLGYKPAQIDAWIDSRRSAPGAAAEQSGDVMDAARSAAGWVNDPAGSAMTAAWGLFQ